METGRPFLRSLDFLLTPACFYRELIRYEIFEIHRRSLTILSDSGVPEACCYDERIYSELRGTEFQCLERRKQCFNLIIASGMRRSFLSIDQRKSNTVIKFLSVQVFVASWFQPTRISLLYGKWFTRRRWIVRAAREEACFPFSAIYGWESMWLMKKRAGNRFMRWDMCKMQSARVGDINQEKNSFSNNNFWYEAGGGGGEIDDVFYEYKRLITPVIILIYRVAVTVVSAPLLSNGFSFYLNFTRDKENYRQQVFYFALKNICTHRWELKTWIIFIKAIALWAVSFFLSPVGKVNKKLHKNYHNMHVRACCWWIFKLTTLIFHGKKNYFYLQFFFFKYF